VCCDAVDDDEKKFISIRARCCSMRGIQKRYIKEEKIYPNHPRALCVHACSVHLEVCVYIVYAFRGPPTMDQHARARCIFDDLSMITILGRRYLQQHREPYVDYCYTRHAKGQMRAYMRGETRLLCAFWSAMYIYSCLNRQRNL
jgi:hypothetical protein